MEICAFIPSGCTQQVYGYTETFLDCKNRKFCGDEIPAATCKLVHISVSISIYLLPLSLGWCRVARHSFQNKWCTTMYTGGMDIIAEIPDFQEN